MLAWELALGVAHAVLYHVGLSGCPALVVGHSPLSVSNCYLIDEPLRGKNFLTISAQAGVRLALPIQAGFIDHVRLVGNSISTLLIPRSASHCAKTRTTRERGRCYHLNPNVLNGIQRCVQNCYSDERRKVFSQRSSNACDTFLHYRSWSIRQNTLNIFCCSIDKITVCHSYREDTTNSVNTVKSGACICDVLLCHYC